MRVSNQLDERVLRSYYITLTNRQSNTDGRRSFAKFAKWNPTISWQIRTAPFLETGEKSAKNEKNSQHRKTENYLIEETQYNKTCYTDSFSLFSWTTPRQVP